MSELDFPDITEAASAVPATTQVPALKPTAALDIEKIDLNALAIAKFGDWRGGVAAARKTLDGAVHDLSTQAKVDEAKSLRFRLIGQPRADVRKVSKALKSKLAAVSKSVGAEEELAVADYDAAETLITPLIEAREAVLIAELAERKRIESERVGKHQTAIAVIRAFLAHCQQPGMSAERIQAGIDILAEQAYSVEHWQEFAVPAASAQCETLEAMRNLHALAVEREAEAARLDAQRIEQARIAEEQAAEQAELDRKAAEFKANMDRIKGHQQRIDEIKAAATRHEGQPAATIAEAITAVAALNVTDASYQEMAPLAAAAQAGTLQVLWRLHDDAAERERLAAEAVEKFQAQRAEVTTPQEPQQVLKAEPVVADATDRDVPADTSPSGSSMGAGQAAAAAPAGDVVTQGAIHVDPQTGDQFRVSMVVSPMLPEPTLTMGAINEAIAPLKIDGAGLALLGFEPAATRKGAKLFHESDWPAMHAAMMKHLAGAA